MSHEPSLWSFIANAAPVVKLVMLLLFAASLYSWTIIFQRFFFFQSLRLAMTKFEEHFWSGEDLNQFYLSLRSRQGRLSGLEHLFCAGFSEFFRLKKQPLAKAEDILIGAERAIEIALARESMVMEQHLPWLATIGSISPYVGLFGTVWGIMSSFRALSSIQQATIAMVAPGISEALIATAMGLFAAIPAVVAYNRYSTAVEQLVGEYGTFKEELLQILRRQVFQHTESGQ